MLPGQLELFPPKATPTRLRKQLDGVLNILNSSNAKCVAAIDWQAKCFDNYRRHWITLRDGMSAFPVDENGKHIAEVQSPNAKTIRARNVVRAWKLASTYDEREGRE